MLNKMLNQIRNGFTLIEMLLVMVVISTVMVMGVKYYEQRAQNLQVDRMVSQIQYLLNAGLTFYVANGRWPDPVNTAIILTAGTPTELKPDYLPDVSITSPFNGFRYELLHVSDANPAWGVPGNTFVVIGYVGKNTKQREIAKIIIGRLPFATYESSSGAIYAYVGIPAQSLNNATALNFAGIYHHGACVPVPTCPVDGVGSSVTMVPQVFVAPVSVSGVNDNGNTNVYPISSFTAYATGGTDSAPPPCANATVTPACTGGGANNMYWRVCLQVVTERGDVASTRTDNWGQNVTMSAFTRCAPATESSGSGFNIYGD